MSIREKYVYERFPYWTSIGPAAVQERSDSARALEGAFLVEAHNRTVDALIDAVSRLSYEQQAQWLAAWDRRS